jgi:hypothetical protein
MRVCGTTQEKARNEEDTLKLCGLSYDERDYLSKVQIRFKNVKDSSDNLPSSD